MLVALSAGKVTAKEMEGASGVNWLGLTPRAVAEGLVEALQAGAPADEANIDIADLEAQRVDVAPLLLLLGLLSLAPGRPTVCRPPNEYAT